MASSACAAYAKEIAARCWTSSRVCPSGLVACVTTVRSRSLRSGMDHLVDIGCCGREAVAAIDLVSGAVVGIARFVRADDDPLSAEVAFEVVDACQSSGVGRRLVAELGALAKLEGIERFRAHVVPGNEAALALMRRLGRVVRSSYADGTYELEVALGP